MNFLTEPKSDTKYELIHKINYLNCLGISVTLINMKELKQRKSKYANHSRLVKSGNEDRLFDILENCSTPFLLILDQIQDPHNLGACLRSANAAGVDAVIAPKDRSVGITDVVINVASGAAEHTPFIQVTNLARVMDQLKEKNIWLIGTADDAPESIFNSNLSGAVALVMGSEGKGMRRLTRERCDKLVKIPMARNSKVECLNVSVATGVGLFEIVRQKSKK